MCAGERMTQIQDNTITKLSTKLSLSVGTKIQSQVKLREARTIKEHLEVSRFIHQAGQHHLKVSVATAPSLVTIGTTVVVGAVAQICLDDRARTTLAVIETSQFLQDSWREEKIQTKCEDLAHNACNICLWSVYIKTIFLKELKMHVKSNNKKDSH